MSILLLLSPPPLFDNAPWWPKTTECTRCPQGSSSWRSWLIRNCSPYTLGCSLLHVHSPVVLSVDLLFVMSFLSLISKTHLASSSTTYPAAMGLNTTTFHKYWRSPQCTVNPPRNRFLKSFKEKPTTECGEMEGSLYFVGVWSNDLKNLS